MIRNASRPARLLYEIAQASVLPQSEIARRMRQTRAAVSFRLKRIEEGITEIRLASLEAYLTAYGYRLRLAIGPGTTPRLVYPGAAVAKGRHADQWLGRALQTFIEETRDDLSQTESRGALARATGIATPIVRYYSRGFRYRGTLDTAEKLLAARGWQLWIWAEEIS